MKTNNQIKTGAIISHYKIEKLIGTGSFGQVYLANDIGTTNYVAIKIELGNDENKSMEKEIEILKKINGSYYFPIFYESGKINDHSYFVMELLGSSLSQMRTELDDSHYSLYTSLKIALEMLKCIQSLHKHGFIHRDIKPANFLIRPNIQKPLCLIDFGLSENLYDEQTHKHKPFERNINFTGSRRYASVNAHEHTSLSRRDDLMSWFYSFVELYVGSLPWSDSKNSKVLAETKKKARPTDICSGIPVEFVEIYRILRCLRFEDEPPYERIQRLIQSAIDKHCNPPYKYDWEDFCDERVALVSSIKLNEQQQAEERANFCRI